MESPLITLLGDWGPSWLLDIGPVGFIFFSFAVTWLSLRHGSSAETKEVSIGVAVIMVSLLVRRRWPLGVLAISIAVMIWVGEFPIVVLAVLLAVFTVAEYSSRRELAVAAGASVIALVALPLAHEAHVNSQRVMLPCVAVGLAAALGLYLRTRADYIVGLRERAERLERERELLSEQAVAEERVRIARELHDVVAHNVSLMVVQAQALAATAGDDDDETLGRVAGLGREALGEMHRMLGVLRLEDGAAAEREPQPGVADLEALVARTQKAGLRACLQVWGEPRELPPGVSLSVYRIAQEALTNVIRHAGAASAEVTLSFEPGAVDLAVVDDGTGTGDGSDGEGHGLVGMRERVALFGGQLFTGRREDGNGYRVHAVIPVR